MYNVYTHYIMYDVYKLGQHCSYDAAACFSQILKGTLLPPSGRKQ